MSRKNRRWRQWIPSGFLWRLTFLNTIVIVGATVVSGWAIYNTACFLAAGVGNLDEMRQQQFNSTLLNYLWTFMIMAVISGSAIHFYLTKRLINPIRSLILTTKQLKEGHYPEPIKVHRQDEIGQLVVQYNGLIEQLKVNDQQRKKLISDMSHEIRTPLSNLNGYLFALKEGDLLGNPELFTSLHKESKRLSKMVEQFEQLKEWDYLSNQSLTVNEETDMKQVLNQCVKMFDWTLQQKNIQLKVNASSSVVKINIEEIQQVVSNLLDNAIRYYEGEGPIVLTGEVQMNCYRVSIKGPSMPIPDHEAELVFNRFYRLDPSRNHESGGSGLGLAIAKEIVERHHQGTIGIDTDFKSNTFWFVLQVNDSN